MYVMSLKCWQSQLRSSFQSLIGERASNGLCSTMKKKTRNKKKIKNFQILHLMDLKHDIFPFYSFRFISFWIKREKKIVIIGLFISSGACWFLFNMNAKKKKKTTKIYQTIFTHASICDQIIFHTILSIMAMNAFSFNWLASDFYFDANCIRKWCCDVMFLVVCVNKLHTQQTYTHPFMIVAVVIFFFWYFFRGGTTPSNYR